MSKRVVFQLCRAMLLGVAMLVAANVTIASSGAAADGTTQTAALPDNGANVLMGVGLVVGLPGTGDGEVDGRLVERSIVGVLKRAGLDLWRGQIEPLRVAKVVITAELQANARVGAPVVVSVTAIGDATSLAGGTLLATPLRDLNGTVYAVSQGGIKVRGQVVIADGKSQQSEIGAREGVLVGRAVVDPGHHEQLAAE